jgi:hypothetical protein
VCVEAVAGRQSRAAGSRPEEARGAKRPATTHRRVRRHVERLWEALRQAERFAGALRVAERLGGVRQYAV